MIDCSTRVVLDCLSMSWAAFCAQSVEAFNLSPAERKTAYGGPEVKWSAAGLDCVHGHGLWWRWRVFVCLHRVWCPAFHLPPPHIHHTPPSTRHSSLCAHGRRHSWLPLRRNKPRRRTVSLPQGYHSIFWSWEEKVLCSLAKGNRPKYYVKTMLLSSLPYEYY